MAGGNAQVLFTSPTTTSSSEGSIVAAAGAVDWSDTDVANDVSRVGSRGALTPLGALHFRSAERSGGFPRSVRMRRAASRPDIIAPTIPWPARVEAPHR